MKIKKHILVESKDVFDKEDMYETSIDNATSKILEMLFEFDTKLNLYIINPLSLNEMREVHRMGNIARNNIWLKYIKKKKIDKNNICEYLDWLILNLKRLNVRIEQL